MKWHRFIPAAVIPSLLVVGFSWAQTFLRVRGVTQEVEVLLREARGELNALPSLLQFPAGPPAAGELGERGRKYQAAGKHMGERAGRAFRLIQRAQALLAPLPEAEREAVRSSLNGVSPAKLIPYAQSLSKGLGPVEDLGRSLEKKGER